MSKMIIGLAAIGTAAMLALPAPAVAKDRPADGVRNADQLEVSAARKRRHVRRHYAPRYSYYRPQRYSYYRPYYEPYYAYGYSPYYYRSGPHLGIGPGGFSFGFGF